VPTNQQSEAAYSSRCSGRFCNDDATRYQRSVPPIWLETDCRVNQSISEIGGGTKARGLRRFGHRKRVLEMLNDRFQTATFASKPKRAVKARISNASSGLMANEIASSMQDSRKLNDRELANCDRLLICDVGHVEFFNFENCHFNLSAGAILAAADDGRQKYPTQPTCNRRSSCRKRASRAYAFGESTSHSCILPGPAGC
jgi:hypothetical protein